jgi:general secretion pathway protein H
MKYLYKNGFTLLELIIVLFIVGIAASIVTVSVNRAYKKSIVRQEAKRIHGILRHARELSLLQRTPVVFALDEENNIFWLEKDGAVYGKVKTVPRGIRLSGEPIVFLPKGNSTGGLITLMDSEERGYSIEVDPVTGTATVKRL